MKPADDAVSRLWREHANAVGVPANVWSVDSRAGGITETVDATSLEKARKAATHGSVSTTARYDRTRLSEESKVMDIRVAARRAKAGE